MCTTFTDTQASIHPPFTSVLVSGLSIFSAFILLCPLQKETKLKAKPCRPLGRLLWPTSACKVHSLGTSFGHFMPEQQERWHYQTPHGLTQSLTLLLQIFSDSGIKVIFMLHKATNSLACVMSNRDQT